MQTLKKKSLKIEKAKQNMLRLHEVRLKTNSPKKKLQGYETATNTTANISVNKR